MANPWFRMYHEFATDPKVQMLSEVDQRRFVMLLCLKCCNGDVTLHERKCNVVDTDTDTDTDKCGIDAMVLLFADTLIRDTKMLTN